MARTPSAPILNLMASSVPLCAIAPGRYRIHQVYAALVCDIGGVIVEFPPKFSGRLTDRVNFSLAADGSLVFFDGTKGIFDVPLIRDYGSDSNNNSNNNNSSAVADIEKLFDICSDLFYNYINIIIYVIISITLLYQW